MNEIKRQLDQKMGDTKERANNLITKIHAEKQQNNQKKSPSRIPYFVTLGSFAAVIILFILVGPYGVFQNTSTDNPNEKIEESTTDNFQTLKSYFRKSGDIASYIGTGSDIASYTVHTTWLADNYVQHLIKNDGANVQRIFRITNEEIQLIFNKEINEPPALPDAETLDQMPVITVLLKTPLENGNTFDEKTVSFPETVDTPIGQFENAVKVSEKLGVETNHVYYVPNEGIVKTVYLTSDGTEIVSELSSVTEDGLNTLKSYFRKSGDISHYVGTGNEYATYTAETTWLAEDYVQTVEDNGGGITQKIYRITEDEIQLIFDELIEDPPARFELMELDQMSVESVLIKTPLEHGSRFDGKIVSFPETVDTPIGYFENAIKITEEIDHTTSHVFYVPNEGIVKRVFSFDDGSHEIISELSSVVSKDQPPLKSFFRKSGDIAYYVGNFGDTTTNNVETTWLSENYVQQITEYEGTVIQSIYRITENEIQLVYSGNAEYETAHFELTELDQLPVESVLLRTPLENGSTFDGKTVSFPVAVDTPIGYFDNAVKISGKNDSFVWHKYYVPNEGMVKEVWSFDDDGQDMMSVLSSVGASSN